MPPQPIPQLSTSLPLSPTPLPNCCLSLSRPLLTTLSTLLPSNPSSFTLSIGSGSGLLEALLMHRHPTLHIEGVEVSPSVNLYLPEENLNIVSGTWELCPRAADAGAWMFVYPREPGLVRRYLDEFAGGKVEKVVWLGPKADWEDYSRVFYRLDGWEVEVMSNGMTEEGSDEVGIGIGIAGFEMLVVLRRLM
ncbi:hypothetical protein BJX61DRAFT_536303 [Aspergillus egyptiacus]|nr:hypothetical protein BJX61DRAFT_536303 [Aspergillus egyptiacus]